MISTSLWKGKITTTKNLHNINNPGLLVIRQKDRKGEGSYRSPRKGLACLVSELYALTAAFLIKDHEGRDDSGGLFVTRSRSKTDIVQILAHNEYNPQNQYDYDVGIIKVSNITNFQSMSP